MTAGFWATLNQPIIGLSPMDGVTDHPFRSITKKYGNPDVLYTEFTSVEGVCHGATRLLDDFLFDETQRPVVGQVYGTTPDYFRQTAIVLCELGFDGIDINMGCPAKNVAHSGAGAALITTPKLAQEIVRATKLGVEEWVNGKSSRDCPNLSPETVAAVEERHAALPPKYQRRRSIPISIKTRIGYDQPVVNEWIPQLLEVEPAAIALHGRTLKQHYGGRANWDEIGRAATMVRQTSTLILGNGDIKSHTEALERIQTYGTHGALLGRAAFGHPRVFEKANQVLANTSIYEIALEHARLFEHVHQQSERYQFLPMRKHLGWYIHDIPHAAEVRQAIYRANSSQDFVAIMKSYGLLV